MVTIPAALLASTYSFMRVAISSRCFPFIPAACGSGLFRPRESSAPKTQNVLVETRMAASVHRLFINVSRLSRLRSGISPFNHETACYHSDARMSRATACMESTSQSLEIPGSSVPMMDEEPGLSSLQVSLLAFGAGAMVANIYYSQPLLSAIASDFRISVSAVGTVAMLSQLGTALGMFAFVPMGDTKERRSLIVRLVLGASLTLIVMATVRNFWWLSLACCGVGLTGSVVHVIVPYAAHLALPARRGATIGAVLSGLLLGILLARTISGFAGAWLGWRAMYWIAA